MLDKQTQPLEIARKVLKQESINMILGATKSIKNSGYLIADRWALNSPETLVQVEKKNLLYTILVLQQEKEGKALFSETARLGRAKGQSNWEILDLMGIKTDLKESALEEGITLK